MNFPFNASDLISMQGFRTGVAFVRTNGRVYLSGVNDVGQMCSNPINNQLVGGDVGYQVVPGLVVLAFIDYVAIGASHALIVSNNSLYICG